MSAFVGFPQSIFFLLRGDKHYFQFSRPSFFTFSPVSLEIVMNLPGLFFPLFLPAVTDKIRPPIFPPSTTITFPKYIEDISRTDSVLVPLLLLNLLPTDVEQPLYFARSPSSFFPERKRDVLNYDTRPPYVPLLICLYAMR